MKPGGGELARSDRSSACGPGDATFVVIVETRIDAEASAGLKAFVASIDRGLDGGIVREDGLEVVDYENRRALAIVSQPGRLLVARRWWFAGDRLAGGEIWFTLDEEGGVRALDAGEVGLALGGQNTVDWRAIPESGEFPVNVFCRPTYLSGLPITRGAL